MRSVLNRVARIEKIVRLDKEENYYGLFEALYNDGVISSESWARVCDTFTARQILDCFTEDEMRSMIAALDE